MNLLPIATAIFNKRNIPSLCLTVIASSVITAAETSKYTLMTLHCLTNTYLHYNRFYGLCKVEVDIIGELIPAKYYFINSIKQ